MKQANYFFFSLIPHVFESKLCVCSNVAKISRASKPDKKISADITGKLKPKEHVDDHRKEDETGNLDWRALMINSPCVCTDFAPVLN